MAEFEVGGHTYRSTKLSARVAFHVARRLAPVIGRMDLSRAVGQITGDTQIAALLPMADAIASMTDVDCDYVINACMAVCERQFNGTWAKVWHTGAAKPMFEDIELPALMQITLQVLGENLSSFFSGPLPATAGRAAA